MILHSVKNDIVDHSVYLKADGSVDLTGNLSVDAGVTLDGVDISEHDHSGAGKGGTVLASSIGAGALNIGVNAFTVNSIEIVGSDGEVNAAAIEDNFLKNYANDTGKSLVLTDASDIPLVLNNSTGTQNIFEVKDNGNTVFHIKDGGVMEFMDGTDGSPASIGAIFRLDNQLTGVGKRFFAVKLVQEGVVTSGTTNTGNYNLTVDSASTGTTFISFWSFMQTRHADANLPYAHSGFYEIKATLGHMQEANALRTRLVIVDGTIDDLTGLRINNVVKTGSGSVTNLYGIFIENLTEGSTNCAIVLNGDGVGSDITFGAGQDVKIDYDGTNLRLQPHIVGTGHLDIVGTYGTAVETLTSDTTLDETHSTVLVDASGGNKIITLPAVSDRTGRIYTIKKIDSSGNTVTVDGNASENIDGSTTKILSSQYDSIRIQNDGSGWYIL